MDQITIKFIIDFESSNGGNHTAKFAAEPLLCSLCEAIHKTLKVRIKLACHEFEQTWAGAKGRTALAGAQREAETNSRGKSPRATATAAPSMCRIWYSMKDDPVMLT